MVEAIDAVIISSKADSMTFADFKAVGNAAALQIAKESRPDREEALADSLLASFKLFRPSLGADDLKNYELVYREFEHRESKSAAVEATSQKLMLK